MVTQIYAMISPEDAVACIEAGADYIGFLPPQQRDIVMQEEITHEVACEIMKATDGKAVRVTISLNEDPEFLFHLARTYHPEIIHISAFKFKTNAEFHKKFKAEFPDIRLLQAILVADETAVETAKQVEPYCDLLILDSPSVGAKPGIGGSGNEHDRALDKAVIDAVSIPVIIAGGLDETNVADAINETKPWGVDTMSRTNIYVDGIKTFKKDIEKVRLFCQRAKEA